MTYCVAVSVDRGIIFTSDSRTNAGIDQVSIYSKMYRFGVDGERQFIILSAGNLATTQGVISRIKKDIKNNAEVSLMTVGDINEAADYLGEISVFQQNKHAGSVNFEASFIIGGQVSGKKHGIALVYPQGNHITSSPSTPYLQIGESKYGKPILDRIITPTVSLETAALCTLVSMDSTIRSNLTVGPPIETTIYEADSLLIQRYHKFEEDSNFLRQLNRSWDERLREAFNLLPPLDWSFNWDNPSQIPANSDNMDSVMDTTEQSPSAQSSSLEPTPMLAPAAQSPDQQNQLSDGDSTTERTQQLFQPQNNQFS